MTRDGKGDAIVTSALDEVEDAIERGDLSHSRVRENSTGVALTAFHRVLTQNGVDYPDDITPIVPSVTREIERELRRAYQDAGQGGGATA